MSASLSPSIENVLLGHFTFRHMDVVRTTYVTPKMLRITFGGPEVANMRSLGPCDDVRIQVPENFADVPLPPIVHFEPFKLEYPDDAPPSIIRAYTVRRLDHQSLELDIDFALHDHPGLATRWALQAQRGQRIAIGGPMWAKVPTNYQRVFLAGDETGLPGLGRAIEMLPPGARATAIFEVESATEEQQFTTLGDLDLTWVHRNNGGRLIDAVRKAEAPDNTTILVVTGESGTVNEVRRYMKNDIGITNKEIAFFVGYWKRGVSADDPHDHDEEDHDHDEEDHDHDDE